MEPRYVLIFDFCSRCLSIIELTGEELLESENYENFEDFLSTIEDKYGFRQEECLWMATEQLNICRYKNGESDNEHTEAQTLAKIREWAENYPYYLSNREGYARGYRDAMLYAHDIVMSIITGEPLNR